MQAVKVSEFDYQPLAVCTAELKEGEGEAAQRPIHCAIVQGAC